MRLNALKGAVRAAFVFLLLSVSSTSTWAALTLNLGATTSNSVEIPLSIAGSFNDHVAALNLAVATDYQFGTSATGTAPVVPITNFTDLGTYFNAAPDAVGVAVQNSEIERFAPTFNTTNHVFGTSDIELTAALEAGGNFDVINETLIGAVSNSTLLTFASTTGIQDGMLFSVDGQSLVGGGACVVSHTSTTVNTSTWLPLTLPNNSHVRFLPAYCALGTAAGSSQTVLHFSIPIPAGVAAGMFYTNLTSGTFAIRRVVSVTSNTVTLDGGVTTALNDTIVFQPPVTSGEMWTKAGYQPGKNGVTYVAIEMTANIPVNTAQGSWLAWWLYSRTSEGNPSDASEIDLFEYYYSNTTGPNAWSSGILGGYYNDFGLFYKLTVGSKINHWDTSGFYRGLPDMSLAQHKYQVIWTPDKVYRYIDGVLTICNRYLWSSGDTAQLGFDLSVGSFLPAFMGIGLFPQTTAQFPSAFKIAEVKIWQR